MLGPRPLEELLAPGEQLGVEFKGPGPLSDTRLRAQAVRAIMGLANRRDGGTLVIGVDAAPGRFDVRGLQPGELNSWDGDAVADAVAAYADPPPRTELTVKQHVGKTLVVISVAEFEDVPVLCRKSWGDVLAEGALYVRGRRKPETTPVRTHADMRDLLELAIEKRLRAYVATADRARLRLTTEAPSDVRAAFDRQAAEL